MSPLHDCILVRSVNEVAMSAGGIALHHATVDKNRGEVVAVGPGRKCDNGTNVEVTVAVGDKVILGPRAVNNTIKLNGEELLIVSETDIYGVVE